MITHSARFNAPSTVVRCLQCEPVRDGVQIVCLGAKVDLDRGGSVRGKGSKLQDMNHGCMSEGPAGGWLHGIPLGGCSASGGGGWMAW